MNRVCLDTSAYSHFRRGEPRVVDLVSCSREVCVPVIVLGELRTGFRLGGQAERNEAALREFLSHPIVRILEVDDDAATCYAELVAVLRRMGTPLPTNDIWIAALALREGAAVVTYDEHFRAIDSISKLILEKPRRR